MMAKRRAVNWLIVATILTIGVNAASAIVQKQQQQSSQQQRSDESSQQSAYSHNQQVGVSSPAQSASSSSSSIGQNGQQQQVAASSNNPNQQQQSEPSNGGGQSYGSPAGGISAVQPGASYVNSIQKQVPAYMDQMAAAASNPEQSYQAAAQSVNMALANQGILSNGNAYNNQPGGQQSGQQSAGQGSAGSALNPLHYFYYPAAKESIQGPSKQADAMASSASNQYQYTNYRDQYQPSYGNSPGPDVAASSQEASYMAQPMDGPIQAQQQHQQPQPQHQQPQHNFNQNDLASYASNQMQQQQPQQQPSTVSFGGPAAGQAGSQIGQGNNQASNVNDYMNSHMGGHQQQQQQHQQAGGPPSYQQNAQNMFNQLASGGDLSTSNFGNNAGGMSSIASYMAPAGGASQNGQQNAHELFASALLNANQFNSAASQLSPSSISPPAASNSAAVNGQQQQPQQSMFSSSLFGGQSQQQQPQVQAQQQANGGLYGDASNYLNSLMTAQQYSQLTGQQMPMASEHSLGLANAIGAQQAQQVQQAQHAVNSATTSSKRFGLGSFIMPVLALAGLSLLIPTMSSLGTAAVGRKKRSIVEEKASVANRQQQIAYEPLLNGPSQLLKEGSLSDYMDRIERFYGIYRNAVESDECRNRLICEFGDAIKDIGGTGPVMSVIERMVPSWMANKMSLFKEAAMNSRESREKCKMYTCKTSAGGSRQH